METNVNTKYVNQQKEEIQVSISKTFENLNVKIQPYDESFFETCVKLRYEIFVKGQNVPLEREQDGLDKESIHILMYLDKEPIGVTRLRFIKKMVKIERVGVLDKYRGKGFGNFLMDEILKYIKQVKDEKQIIEAFLSSQVSVIKFYEKFGFVSMGESYVDAGIDHKDMRLEI